MKNFIGNLPPPIYTFFFIRPIRVFTLFVLLSVYFTTNLFGQYTISMLEDRVNQSELIIEGKVV